MNRLTLATFNASVALFCLTCGFLVKDLGFKVLDFGLFFLNAAMAIFHISVYLRDE